MPNKKYLWRDNYTYSWNRFEHFAFYDHETKQLVRILWALDEQVSATVDAYSKQATLVYQDQSGQMAVQSLSPDQNDNRYHVTLDGSPLDITRLAQVAWPVQKVIGDRPRILIEEGVASPPVPPMPPAQCSSSGVPWGFDRGVSGGLEMIRNTLRGRGIPIGDNDPPVPGMWFSTAPFPTLPGGASHAERVNIPATHSAPKNKFSSH